MNDSEQKYWSFCKSLPFIIYCLAEAISDSRIKNKHWAENESKENKERKKV